jgi:hypothetical protein
MAPHVSARTLVLCGLAANIVVPLFTLGCGHADASAEAANAAGLELSAFRIRSDPDAALNGPSGWAGAENEAAVVRADEPFRLRVEVEAEENADGAGPFGLQVRRNGGDWTNVLARDFPYPDEISSPRVSVVTTSAYSPGAGTDDVLAGSALPFLAGAGISLDSVTPVWQGGGVHGEWEWPLVIRRFADGAVTNDEGDTFEFRVVDGTSAPVAGLALPTVTLAVPERHLGGTYVETPGRLGPWQATNGDLYFVMEPAETHNVLMVVKSADGGRSWREVDGANRPATDDLEGFATDFADSRIHMLHQTSDAVVHHVFRTSDVASAADTWETRDEAVDNPGEPPTQVAAIVRRTDGSLVAVYGDSAGLRLRVRVAGSWSDATIINRDGAILSGPQLAVGEGDVVHLAYTGDDGRTGTVWLRSLAPDGTLAAERRIADGLGTADGDAGSVAPLTYLPGARLLVFVYRLADGSLMERRAGDDGTISPPAPVTTLRVAQNAVDSEQVGADAIADDETVHLLFIDETSRALYHTYSSAPGRWAPATPVVEDITAQWVRGARLVGADGAPVYGFVYDAGSDGGSGMNRYAEVPLAVR